MIAPDGAVQPHLHHAVPSASSRRPAYEAIKRFQRKPELVPDITYLTRDECSSGWSRRSQSGYSVGQLGLEAVVESVDVGESSARSRR